MTDNMAIALVSLICFLVGKLVGYMECFFEGKNFDGEEDELI